MILRGVPSLPACRTTIAPSPTRCFPIATAQDIASERREPVHPCRPCPVVSAQSLVCVAGRGKVKSPELRFAVKHPKVGAVCGVRQEDEQSSCCARDEGEPFGAALQGEASNRHELLQPKAAVVSVVEKA